MLEVLAYATPNSVKVVIALEEMGLPYELRSIDLRRGEQRSEAFKALNSSGKVPVLVDRAPDTREDFIVSESAAILVYLAEKTGRLLPAEAPQRSKVFEQLFFHASGVSPAFLQVFMMEMKKEPDPLAQETGRIELARVLSLLDRKLVENRYTAGDEYTIADIAHFGWVWKHEAMKAELHNYPAVKRWHDDIRARPAVTAAISKTTSLSR